MATMLTLPLSVIDRLARRKFVRFNAVANFLGTLGAGGSKSDAYRNLQADARSYGWNAATVRAISDGISKAQVVSQ